MNQDISVKESQVADTRPPKPQIRIHGNVTRDPERKHIESLDQDVIEFGLAVDLSPSREDKRTEFYDVTIWREELFASVMSEVFKGGKVAVSGSISSRTATSGKIYKTISAYQVGLIEWLRPKPVAAPVAAGGGDDW